MKNLPVVKHTGAKLLWKANSTKTSLFSARLLPEYALDQNTMDQWRRYLWGTGARAPLKFAEKKFGARIKKICLKQRDGMGLYNLIINYKLIIWTGSD
jgi:hypothetical protein